MSAPCPCMSPRLAFLPALPVVSSASQAPSPVISRRRPPLAIATRPRTAPSSVFPLWPSSDVGRVRIERPLPNRRVVCSGVVVAAPLDIVWRVLSDYTRLADYIPNLAMSKRVPHPSAEGIRLEQCGVQRILGFEFRASVTMDMMEIEPVGKTRRAIDFRMVQSRDFKVFEGTWSMEVAAEDPQKTLLHYSVSIVPKGLVPVKAIEWRISEDVPGNMSALKRECEMRNRKDVVARKRAALKENQ